MRHSLIINLISVLFILPLSINSASSKNIDDQSISNQLENGLNNKNNVILKELFIQNSFLKFKQKYLAFTSNYKNAKWSIKEINNHPNKKSLEIDVTATRQVGDLMYNLISKQMIQIETYKNKIKNYQVVNEESILKSHNNPIILKIDCSDSVFTGERYEINIIIEEPLDNSVIGTGIIVLKNSDQNDLTQKFFSIKINKSGGIYKYIQAPLTPGFQTISAIITHPKGIYSITKRIRVNMPNKPFLKN